MHSLLGRWSGVKEIAVCSSGPVEVGNLASVSTLLEPTRLMIALSVQLLDEALASLSSQPIIIRLSGHVQHNDRLALREIARQLSTQTGRSFDIEVTDIEDESQLAADASDPTVPLPPPTYLPTLISALPTLARPTVIILEAFDLFAIHGRQALLYCLLDTAQSCRAGKGSKGIAVIGVTTRVDTINLLEKRVKSRFSGRMLRTAGPGTFDDWISIARNALTAKPSPPNEEWDLWWAAAVEKFLNNRTVLAALSDTYDLTKDVRILNRILARRFQFRLTGPI